jgi:hypothetical protein
MSMCLIECIGDRVGQFFGDLDGVHCAAELLHDAFLADVHFSLVLPATIRASVVAVDAILLRLWRVHDETPTLHAREPQIGSAEEPVVLVNRGRRLLSERLLDGAPLVRGEDGLMVAVVERPPGELAHVKFVLEDLLDRRLAPDAPESRLMLSFRNEVRRDQVICDRLQAATGKPKLSHVSKRLTAPLAQHHQSAAIL